MEDDDDPTTYLINNKLSSNKSFEKNSNNNIENNISINIPRKTFSLKNLYKFGEIPIEESITTFFFPSCSAWLIKIIYILHDMCYFGYRNATYSLFILFKWINSNLYSLFNFRFSYVFYFAITYYNLP